MSDDVNATHALCYSLPRGFHQQPELIDGVCGAGLSVPLPGCGGFTVTQNRIREEKCKYCRRSISGAWG